MIVSLHLIITCIHAFICVFVQTCPDDCYKYDQDLNKTNLRSATESGNCFCDNCDKFNDCCHDFINVTSNELYKYECNVKIETYHHIYSISKCDVNWPNDEIRKKCNIVLNEDFTVNNFFTQIPVYSFAKNFTYKNIFCAKCNNESIKNLKPFNLTTEFPKSFDEEKSYTLEDCFINKSLCSFKYSAPSQNILKTLRNCINSIKNCPENITGDLAGKCLNHTAYRYYFNDLTGVEVYKNKYCAKCNGINESLLECGYSLNRGMFLHSMQLLFDLSELNGNIHVAFSIKNQSLLNTDLAIDRKCNNSSTDIVDKIICSDDFEEFSKNKTDISTGDLIKSYLTFCGNIISIVSLVILLIIYTVLKNLRNLAGKMLMSLCGALLFAQSFFLISMHVSKDSLDIKIVKNFTVCYLFGVLTHYFYLTYFAWSNIMSYDLFKVLNIYSMRNNDKSISTNVFKKYSIYAWGSPVIVITILLLTQISREKLYGFNVCFLTYKIDLLIFFIVPISCILISNLIFFIVSIISIRKVDKTSNLYLKKTDSNDLNNNNTNVSLLDRTESETDQAIGVSSKLQTKKMVTPKLSNTNNEKTKQTSFQKQRLILFAKLFVLMGISWISCVLNSFYKDTFIWFILILINSLQGFLIFLTIIFNRQTIKEMKQNNQFFKCFT
jgi:hypothetical protein